MRSRCDKPSDEEIGCCSSTREGDQSAYNHTGLLLFNFRSFPRLVSCKPLVSPTRKSTVTCEGLWRGRSPEMCVISKLQVRDPSGQFENLTFLVCSRVTRILERSQVIGRWLTRISGIYHLPAGDCRVLLTTSYRRARSTEHDS